MSKNYLQLKDVRSYGIALLLSNKVWKIVVKWDWFAKKTVGDQFVRAVDSCSANIAEGFGRYTKKDKIKFYRYTYGSIKESQDWVLKSYTRKLLEKEDYDYIMGELNKLPKEVNHLIKFTEEKLKF